MNRKMLIRSGIMSLVFLVLFFLMRFLLESNTFFIVKTFFFFFSVISGMTNCFRWMSAYGRVRPKASYFASIWPHPTENAPEANVLCLNVFKWAISMFLVIFL